MTLNASGPISLGGSIVGQSINLELGNSATAQADINSTPFRTLAGVASGQISLSNFYGKSNIPGMGAYSSIHIGYEPPPIMVKASSSSTYFYCDFGNRFSGLQISASATTLINNADPSNCYYKKSITRTTPSQHIIDYLPYPLALDNNSYIVLSGYHENGNGGTAYNGYMRVNATTSAVSVNTAYYFPETSGSYTTVPPIVDSSGNVYCMVKISASPTYMALCKISAANSISWTAGVDVGNSFTLRMPPAFDSSGNIIIASTNGYIAKYNTSGTLQWQKQFSGFNPKSNVATDSSGNIYLSGDNGSGYLATVKLDSTGAVLWSRVYANGTTLLINGTAVAVDSSGNVYSICADSYANYRLYMVKYNSSGSLQWQRYWTHGTTFGNTSYAYVNGDYLQVNFASNNNGASRSFAYGISGAYTTAPFGTASNSDAAAGVTTSTSSLSTSTFSLSLTSFNSGITVSDVSTPVWFNSSY